MTEKGNDNKPGTDPASKTGTGRDKEPQWATGLKQLYNSVVEEPLPDDLAKLLSQLDTGKSE